MLMGRMHRVPSDPAACCNEAFMELFIFGRFHAREGLDGAVAAALREVIGSSRQGLGCLAIEAYRSERDPRLSYVHSRWTDDEAFEAHATMPHTLRQACSHLHRHRLAVDSIVVSRRACAFAALGPCRVVFNS